MQEQRQRKVQGQYCPHTEVDEAFPYFDSDRRHPVACVFEPTSASEVGLEINSRLFFETRRNDNAE